MSARDVVCPSGLAGTIRGLTVNEATIFAQVTKSKKNAGGTILSTAWKNTSDFGPYADPLDWSQVLVGDRLYALMMVRSATHGDDFEFDTACASCRAPVRWRLSLSELPVRKLAAEDAEAFKEGRAVEERMLGRKVAFKLLVGADEQKLQDAAKNADNPMLVSLAARVVSVDDGAVDKMRWLSDLVLGEALDLVDMLDRHDCGVDTDVDIACSCGAETRVRLPFSRDDFWMPSRRRSR